MLILCQFSGIIVNRLLIGVIRVRKFIQKQILDMLPSVWEGIKFAKSGKHKSEAEKILGDCYACLETIDKTLSSSLSAERYAEYSELFDYLRQLLEMLNACIASGENFSEISREIKENLELFERELKAEKEVRLEVAFMPYKASMWDSLESIWKAADEDPDCDAYVVPIPYYDRKPDHSLGEMHYEGNDYPNYVPVVNYDAYSLEKRKPDIIYIHNPYDDCNFVTSVDPRFYSSELKKYTECLVYVPYFVLEEPNLDDQALLDGIEHFVVTPGVINADKVILQSETMKEAYIRILLKYMGGNSENRKYLDKKIFGTGSPKLSKIECINANEINIPDSWKRIIYKANGERKKIIFYNTSVGALLRYNDKMLDKMCRVFDIFFNNRDEIALLWRPHPLIEATIKSMRPQLWEAYKRIADKYIADGWGIYDDTSDLERAIALSDAYYGDGSSVVQLFKKANKNVMIQNPLISQDKKMISVQSAVFINGNLFASCMFDNMIVKIELDNKKCYCVAQVDEDIDYRLFSNGILYKTFIYWIPLNAKKIAIFNIETNSFSYLSLPHNIINSINDKFYVSFLFEDRIFMFGHTISAIVIINCKNNEIDIINLPSSILLGCSFTIANDIAYIPLYNHYKVMCFNLNDFSYTISNQLQEENDNDNWFTEIVCRKSNVVLYDWENREIVWDPLKKEVKERICESAEFSYKRNPFRLVSNSDVIVKIPFFSRDIICITNGTHEIISYSRLINNDINSGEWSFIFSLEDNKSILFQTNTDLKLHVIDKASLNICDYDFTCCIDIQVKRKKYNQEGNLFSLKRMLKEGIVDSNGY